MLSTNVQQTMSSTEIVRIINDMREEGAAVLTHDNFMKKVVKVLGEEGAVKFNASYTSSQNKQLPCYALPKREATLMVMSENYKVQAAVYDRMVELEQKPMTTAELILAQAQLSVELEKRIDQTETEVKHVTAKVEQLSVDLRNGVPHGYVSKSNALRMYGNGLSKAIFELVMTEYDVKTQAYVHYADGHSTPTFGYLENVIPEVIQDFLNSLEQKTPNQCYSEKLNKRLNYKKPTLN